MCFEPSKEEKSKNINARKKTRTAWKSALYSAQIYEEIFSIFVLFFWWGKKKQNKKLFPEIPTEKVKNKVIAS